MEKNTATFIDQLKSDFCMIDGVLYRTSRSKIPIKSGYLDKGCGYWRLKYKGKAYLLHRLVFLWENGFLPEFVDHIDRDRSNNHPSNLRACDYKGQNTINSIARSDNTSGYKGVTWHKHVNKWHSSVFKNGKRYYCGVFEDKDEAAIAYNVKAKELFGEFAVLNEIK